MARNAKNLQVEADCASTSVPRDNMIGFTLFPIQVIFFQAFEVCAPTSLLTQDLTAIPSWNASSVFINHSTEHAVA